MAGIYGLVKLMKRNGETPEAIRAQVGTEVIVALGQFPKKSNQFHQDALHKSFVVFDSVKQYVISSLAIALLEVESISALKAESITQEAFCECIFQREKLSDRLFLLSSALKKWDSHTDSEDLIGAVKRKLNQERRVGSDLPPWKRADPFDIQTTRSCCFVCHNRFLSCNHICHTCQHRLNAMPNPMSCPACNRWTYEAPQLYSVRVRVRALSLSLVRSFVSSL